jgi:DNA-directed RNA polymerase specialized sigma24 family protein
VNTLLRYEVGGMTLAQMTELYDATVDDVWRTARGSGADPEAAAAAVTEAYVALWHRQDDQGAWQHARLWLMARVYRTIRPEVVAA